MAYGYRNRNLPARYGTGLTGYGTGLSTYGRDPISSVFDEMDRMMGRLARSFRDEDGSQGPANFAFSPSIDLDESDERYELSIELPGIRKDDIDITTQEDVLVITGEKHGRARKSDEREDEEDGTNEGRRHVRERIYGRFERRLRLPADADTENISADFDDGVLTVDIPKREEAQPERRKIEIK